LNAEDAENAVLKVNRDLFHRPFLVHIVARAFSQRGLEVPGAWRGTL